MHPLTDQGIEKFAADWAKHHYKCISRGFPKIAFHERKDSR